MSCRQYKWLSIIHVSGCHFALFPNLDHFGDLVYSTASKGAKGSEVQLDVGQG